MLRRLTLAGCAVLALLPAAWADNHEAAAEAASVGETVTVYKSPTCGCCKRWIKHLEAAGFDVEAIDSDDMNAIKKDYDVPRSMTSCHTARVAGYTIEGHVPAEQILRLLRERPDADGLAVPGMPVGSPGMEVGDRVDPYLVMLFGDSGEQTWASYGERDDPAPVVETASSAESG